MSKVILKASAGTGKTYRLSIEYIVSLLRGESYKNILVMTFTKKATSEIGKRVVEFLSILASKSEIEGKKKKKQELIESINSLYPDLVIDEKKILEIYKSVSSNIDNLKIYTIDSFIGKIFKNVVAPSLGLNKYTIVDDDENEEILVKLLENIMEDKESFEIFKDFFIENFEKNVSNYLATLKEIIEGRWKYLLLQESEISFIRERIKVDEKDTEVELIDSLLSYIRDAVEQKGKDEKIEKFINLKFKNYLYFKTVDEKDEFFTKNLELFLENNFWNGTYLRKNKNNEDIYQKILEITERIREKIATKIYNSEILNYEKTVFEFIKKLYEKYDELKLKEGRFSFSDISMYTLEYYRDEKLNLISNDGITEYFQEVFDGKFSTFFIDEFQDTSILQWKLLKGIAQKAENFFCVGDEKQSLYGWRGGEKELFEKVSTIMGGEENALDTCYRSKRVITEYINEIFSKISSQYKSINVDNEEDLTWEFSPVKSKKDEESYVEIVNVEALNEEEKEEKEEKRAAKAIAKILNEKFSERYKGCAVIARTGRELEAIAEELSNFNIPYTLKSKNNLFNHRVNISVFKVLKFLAYDSFFSLLELLRTDLIKAEGKELKYVIENKEFIMSYINGEQKEEKLPELSIGSVLECLKHLKSIYRENSGRVESVVLKVFSNFAGLELYNSNTDLKNSYRFLEVAKMFGSVGELIIAADMNPNNPLFSQVSMEEINAVTLITIHSSKGLEYDSVFYIHSIKPGVGNYFKPIFSVELDESFEKIKNFAIYKHSHKKILNNFEKYFEDKRYSFIKKEELKEGQERINGWYVALTRAITNLFIVMDRSKKQEEKDSHLLNIALNNMDMKVGDFVPAKELEIEESSFNLEDIEKKIDFSPIEIERDKLEENSRKIEEKFSNFSLEREERKKIGIAVHYYFENLIFLTNEEREEAKNKTLKEFSYIIGEERLSKILQSQKLKDSIEEHRDIFSSSWDKIHSEYEIIDENGELKRIDRLMIKNHTENQRGEICIVDFKTGTIENQVEKYNEQLNEYKNIIYTWLKEKKLESLYSITTKLVALKWEDR